ncbi:hypothetical protein [Jeotgalibaca caeni]|uniref:hypothetical protein n=1 Tax=Jeotgalibaca caeni TaxID=3028623 RepID=UPI00237D8191|nr:hypothetical protein [Jeotgalibaca caeni]MDE1549805.1 hypothetical protein [Jeotgalibaca caeni]
MIQATEEYLLYQGKKYIAPEKAGDFKEDMERFKLKGQAARQAFQVLAKGVDSRLSHFHMQRVSGWMNQAQIGRPHFWCYFQPEFGSKMDPTFAIRLLTLDGQLGISVEVSFIERFVVPETIERQNQVLEVPITEPLYYFVQTDGVSHRETGSEEVRHSLIERVQNGSVRKVLIKYDIPRLADYDSEEAMVDELLSGFHLLAPYYEATKSKFF